MNPIIIVYTNCQSKQSPVRPVALVASALLLLAGASTACSTANGFGKDVEKTGDKIQSAATR